MIRKASRLLMLIMRRLDELYVRKDDRQDIQNYENHSGVDGNIASHKSEAICWRY